MTSLAVCGLQWGDEGKGKIADYFAKDYNCIVKFNGGDNAGHTVNFNDTKHILNNFPAASLACPENSKIILAAETVFNPKKLLDEYRRFTSFLKNKQILIAKNAHIITDINIKLDEKIENLLQADSIGTTKRGIGPTYANKALRLGIRAEDLLKKDVLAIRLKNARKFYNTLLSFEAFTKEQLDDLIEEYYQCGLTLKDSIWDMKTIYKEVIANKKSKVLYEGCQGAMLDINYGTYPYVTSSSSTLLSIYTSCASRNLQIDRALGVIKCYTTRVGEGELPTEIKDDKTRKLLLESGEEYGATTGRIRRIGWLELPQIKYFLELNSIKEIVMTKLDILFQLPILQICIDYCDGKPIYKKFVNKEIVDLKSFNKNKLTQSMIDYIEYIKNYLSVPITLLGVGSKREDILVF